MIPLAYLGTPYTRYCSGLQSAFIAAASLTARLITSGVHVYSPIVHSHPLAQHGGVDPLDLKIWYPFNETMMKRCDTLIVAHLPGWDESLGVKFEIEYFERARKPIFDLNPDTLTMTKRKLVAA